MSRCGRFREYVAAYDGCSRAGVLELCWPSFGVSGQRGFVQLHEQCVMCQVGLAGRQAAASLGTIGERYGSEKRRTCNWSVAGRPLERVDICTGLGVVV